jgi:predicted nucleotidyltransferase
MMINTAQLIECLERQLGVLHCVVLFGSQGAGTSYAESDIDLAVSAAIPLEKSALMQARMSLMAETGLGVDIVDLRDLSQSTVLLREAVTTGQVLKDTDGHSFFDRMAVILREYEDFRHRRADVERGFLQRLAVNE